VTLARTVRTAALIALLSIAIAALGSELFYLHWLRSVVARSHKHLLNIASAGLDHDVRAALPPGTSRANGEAELRSRGLGFSYDGTSRVIHVVAHDLKGSNPLVQSALALAFHFDGTATLASVDSRVVYTGP
jgi:hypothetical protein